MKSRSWITLILGIVLAVLGIVILVIGGNAGGAIPLVIGGSLCYLGWRGGSHRSSCFRSCCIVIGCAMITWGIYLLPYSKPTLSHILASPLFWGLFSLFGGICANYHGFCRCIRRQE
jgi:uncharacterized membrane protein HdeD (DUF308 family)